MSRAERWTPADDNDLAELHAKGRTAAQIGEQLGRTTAAVQRRLGIVGLSKPRKAVVGDDSTAKAHSVLAQVVQATDMQLIAVRRLIRARAIDAADEGRLLDMLGVTR